MLEGIAALQGIGIATNLIGQGIDAIKEATAGSAQSSFQAALADAANSTVTKMENAEKLSVDALQGKGDMREVVDAVMSAEQSLQAAIAIRDKIVSAYLDVSRMAI